MIELIFSIAVMGIIFLSIPDIAGVVSLNNYLPLEQVAISKAAAHADFILSKPWDKNNVIDKNMSKILILDTNGSLSLKARKGAKSRDTKLNGIPYNASIGLSVSKNNDNILSYNNASYVSPEVFDKTMEGNYTIKSYINYIDDEINNSSPYGDYNNSSRIMLNLNYDKGALTAQITSSIKAVTVKIRIVSSEENKTIVLHGASMNIGSYSVKRKVLQ